MSEMISPERLAELRRQIARDDARHDIHEGSYEADCRDLLLLLDAATERAVRAEAGIATTLKLSLERASQLDALLARAIRAEAACSEARAAALREAAGSVAARATSERITADRRIASHGDPSPGYAAGVLREVAASLRSLADRGGAT